VSGASTVDGTAVHQWARHDGANLRLQFVASGGGYYRLKAQHSGKVLDVSNYSTARPRGRRAVERQGRTPGWRLRGAAALLACGCVTANVLRRAGFAPLFTVVVC
jgi:hypothetical protein